MSEVAGGYNPDRDSIFIENEDGTWTTYGEDGEVNIYDSEGNLLHNSPDGSATNDDEILLG